MPNAFATSRCAARPDAKMKSDPFASVANSILPAVVLCCVALGAALIPMENKKEPVLALLDTLTKAMMSITSFVVGLVPIGVFALVGVAAGTMHIEELVRLQVYIYSYIAIALLLSFWVVPGLVTVLLPVSYRELMRYARKPLIMAFATGGPFSLLHDHGRPVDSWFLPGFRGDFRGRARSGFPISFAHPFQ